MNLLGDYSGGGMLLVVGVSSELVQMHGRRAQGQWTDEPGTNAFDTGAPWYEVYETADGKFLALGALEGRFYQALLAGLGIEATDAPQWDRSAWPALKVRFAEAIRRRTRDEWADVFAGTEACVTPVFTLAEAPSHPHNQARAVFDDYIGRIQPAPAPRFSSSQSSIGSRPPEVGQHTIDVLEALGRDRKTIDALLADGMVTKASD